MAVPESRPGHIVFARGLYPLGLALTLFPLVDIASRLFPSNFDNLQWRFSAIGLTLSSLSVLLIGLAVTGVTAALARHRLVLQLLAVVALLGAAALVVLLVLFGLDTLQVRALVQNVEARPNLYKAVATAFAAGLLAVVALAGTALASRSAARSLAAPLPNGKARANEPVIVFSDSSGAAR